MSFTAVNLSQLPAPDVVETLDFEEILAAMVADLQSRDPSFTALVESDPAYKIMQVAAYRELILRQRINEASRSVMLAYAMGSDLDQIGANFNVVRLMLDPGNPNAVPPVPPIMEADIDFRRRIQLSFEGFSTAGPEGAYIFHALSASADVKDASAISPNPGEVLVSVLSRIADGAATPEMIAAVDATLSDEEVRPLTDMVTVQSATIVTYQITADLYFFRGPDSGPVMQQAQKAAEAYAKEQHRLGADITLSGIYAALHQPGVQRVELTSPAATIVIDETSAAFCTAITLNNGGIDE